MKISLLIFMLSIICCSRSVFAQQKSSTLVFTADTQQPLLIEHLIRKLDHNEKATELIFKDVVAVHPAALFILGDVVSLSFEESNWKKMDNYLKSCADNHIPVYATLGNHEYIFSPKKGEQHFLERFPMSSITGYSEVVDSIGVILLNSNFTEMADSNITKQDKWYHKTITAMGNDPSVKFIIVGCHHSPYTNSNVVKPSVQVQQKFVPAFISSKKAVLFLSGHSHNFERFKIQGKYFLVIGGGGGPHQPLLQKEITPDISHNYKPMFHYLEVRRNNDLLQVISRPLKTDFSGFSDGLVFTVTK